MKDDKKDIDAVIAEIEAALLENEKIDPEAGVFTQDTINAFYYSYFDNTPDTRLPQHFSKRELKEYRKWKQSEIYQLLGEPDKIVSIGKYGVRVAHLYEKARVLQIERSHVWRLVPSRSPQQPLPEHRLIPEYIWCVRCGRTDEYRHHGSDKLCLTCYPESEYVYFRITDLFARGWYKKEINTFLGLPHQCFKNYQGWQTKVYLRGVVLATEETEGWQNRPSVISNRLYLQGLSLSKIGKLLDLTSSECLNYTKKTRKAIQLGHIQRDKFSRK